MIKYLNTEVTFSEVPDEITLCINITGCKNACKGCHSPYLAEDIGKPLSTDSLLNLIEKNKGISCVSFMGGDSNPMRINNLAWIVKNKYPKLKVAWYSGKEKLNNNIDIENFDFIKLGPYIEELGPLNSRTTNQRFYKVIKQDKLYLLSDITNKFWNDNEK